MVPGPFLKFASPYLVEKNFFFTQTKVLIWCKVNNYKNKVIKNLGNDFKKNPVILLTRKLPDLIEKKLSKKYSVIRNKSDKRFSYKELKKKIENVDILVPCISDTIDASIIKAAKKLRLIANFGNGVDNLDLITAEERNILVTNTPDVLTEDTSDIVLTMILMLCRCVGIAQKNFLEENG